MSRSDRFAGYGCIFGGSGFMFLAFVPSWWLSALTLLAIAGACLAFSLAEGE